MSFKYRASVHKCARHEIAGLPYKKSVSPPHNLSMHTECTLWGKMSYHLHCFAVCDSTIHCTMLYWESIVVVMSFTLKSNVSLQYFNILLTSLVRMMHILFRVCEACNSQRLYVFERLDIKLFHLST